MSTVTQRMVTFLANLGLRYMPFADVVTPDLPLSRLLRLSLFQVSVGMVLVLLVGTLNRVMIVELSVPTTLVAVMLAMPLVFAPLRALIGFRSDNHKSALGWRRVPFIWKGSLAQFSGFAIMPFALLVLAGEGMSGSLSPWVGQLSAAAAFLLVGAGAHTVQTAGLALATDLTPPESQPRVVGLMYVMLLLGMIVSALAFGAALADYSPGRLVRVIQSVALITISLNVIAVWKQEARRPQRGANPAPEPDPSFREAWARFCEGEHTLLRLSILGLGTIAFGMADVLLEPFGGHVLNLSVAATTQLTAVFAGGGLVGFGVASRVIGAGTEPYVTARHGALIGIPAFACVIVAAPLQAAPLFVVGNFLIGFGGALFAHGTLTASMHRAPVAQIGLALGAWGAVQATAAGLGVALSGTLRDVAGAVTRATTGVRSEASGYLIVYGLEIFLLCLTVIAIMPLLRRGQAIAATASAEAVADAPSAQT
ncbi:MAG: PucC family protein [Halieaceae bacterium]|nr:PucC family protein [Halieaceae bacterium]